LTIPLNNDYSLLKLPFHSRLTDLTIMTPPVIEAIHKRRSIRSYTDAEVSLDKLRKIIEAGIWAPSGLNNQPWRFIIIRDKDIASRLADQTHYSHIVLAAPALIAVYLDRDAMYDDVKDAQSAGACIQNMLLATEALGLGAVWLGQILKNKAAVNEILELGAHLELMALLAIGVPGRRDQQSSRKPLTDFIVKEL
jgi:nitroreductase